MDCSPPGTSVHGILQERILEWVAMPQRIFLTQGLNPSPPHCRQIVYHLSHQGNLYNYYRTHLIFINFGVRAH